MPLREESAFLQRLSYLRGRPLNRLSPADRVDRVIGLLYEAGTPLALQTQNTPLWMDSGVAVISDELGGYLFHELRNPAVQRVLVQRPRLLAELELARHRIGRCVDWVQPHLTKVHRKVTKRTHSLLNRDSYLSPVDRVWLATQILKPVGRRLGSGAVLRMSRDQKALYAKAAFHLAGDGVGEVLLVDSKLRADLEWVMKSNELVTPIIKPYLEAAAKGEVLCPASRPALEGWRPAPSLVHAL